MVCPRGIDITRSEYLSIRNVTSTFRSDNYQGKLETFDKSNLHKYSSRAIAQELYFQDGGKKIKEANDEINHSYTNLRRNSYPMGRPWISYHGLLNLRYQWTNPRVNYRYLSVKNPTCNNESRRKISTLSWPKTRELIELEEEVMQDQIELVNLAETNGIYHESVKEMQIKLMYTIKFRIIAVYKVAGNKGASTPGVDGKCFGGENKEKAYWEMVETLRTIIRHPRKYQASPVRRVWIPKDKNKKRPLGIPTITDRCLQQLVNLVLEPLVESTSDSNSFGYRKYRNAKMAIGVLRELFKTLDKEYITRSSPVKMAAGIGVNYPEEIWIYDADIKGFFDNINHKFILDNLFLHKVGLIFIESWLKSGVISKSWQQEIFEPTRNGIISPILANFTLNGLQKVVREALWPLTKSKDGKISIPSQKTTIPSYLQVIRYADDFVITSRNKYILNELVIPKVKEFLALRGLEISTEKTKMFRLKDGEKLRYLGYVFHYEEKWKIKNKIMYSAHAGKRGIALYPDKKKVNGILNKLESIVNHSKNLDAYNLIAKLNPILRGWASYFNMGNCTYYRNLVKNQIYKKIWKWAHRKHRRWGKKKIAQIYFLDKNEKTEVSEKEHFKKCKYNKFKGRKWNFQGTTKMPSRYSEKKNETNGQHKRIYLHNITEKGTTIPALVYSVPKKLREIHAYHPEGMKFIEWVAKTHIREIGPYSNRKLQLYKKQKGLCQVCGTLIEEHDFNDEKVHIHHIIPIYKGGSPSMLSNLQLVHKWCHLSIEH